MRTNRGFTLIEFMVGLAVLGILFSVGLPSVSQWTQNAQIRTSAEGALNGIQLARTEAVRRNSTVQVAFDAAGGWVVSVVSSGETIQSRPSNEGSPNIALTYTPAAANTVTFTGFGRVTNNNDGSDVLTQVDVDSTTLSAADSRELRVTVASGGIVRMCDPNLASGDTRAC